MKLQFKLIAAAVAIVAAGHASAAMPVVASANGSDLMFYAFDDATKTSYIQDLGQSFSTFLPANAAAQVSFSVNVAASTDWAAYLTSVGGNTANTTWGVVAGLKSNAANPGYGIESTMRVGDPLGAMTAAKVQGTVGVSLANVIFGVNGVGSATPATGYFSNTGGGDNIANNFGHNGAGVLTYNVDNAIGATSAFQYINGKSTALFSVNQYKNADNVASTFSFDGSTLSYNVTAVVAAVPEPSSYAMMMAGMLVVASVAARRRKSAK